MRQLLLDISYSGSLCIGVGKILEYHGDKLELPRKKKLHVTGFGDNLSVKLKFTDS